MNRFLCKVAAWYLRKYGKADRYVTDALLLEGVAQPPDRGWIASTSLGWHVNFNLNAQQ